MSKNDNYKFSCEQCKYNSNQKHNYDNHLLTAKHKRNVNKNCTNKKSSIEELLIEQYKKTELLQIQVDELKKENNILITKLLELSEKQMGEKTTITNNTTTTTNNNNQTYNINIYLNDSNTDSMNFPLLIKGILNKLMQIGNGDSQTLHLGMDERLQL